MSQTNVVNPVLQQLRDIHLPASVSHWPAAPGWYLLLILVILVMGMFIRQLLIYLQANRLRKLALKELVRLQQQAPAVQIASLSSLLKRVALLYYPREQVAKLYGDAWLKFLDDTANGKTNFVEHGRVLNTAPYQAQLTNENLDSVMIMAKLWLMQQQRRGSGACHV